MKITTVAVHAALAFASAPAWAGVTVLPVPLDGRTSLVAAGRYQLDLGEGSASPNRPVWEGPVKIKSPNGKTCTVDENVAVIEPPLNLVDGHLFYFSTYSGSDSQVYVVDADNCVVRWAGPIYSGPAPRIVTGKLIMEGEEQSGRHLRPLFIDGAGLPSR